MQFKYANSIAFQSAITILTLLSLWNIVRETSDVWRIPSGETYSPLCMFFINANYWVTIVYLIIDFVYLYFFSTESAKMKRIYYIHHMLVGTTVVYSLWSNSSHFYVTSFLTYEITNLPKNWYELSSNIDAYKAFIVLYIFIRLGYGSILSVLCCCTMYREREMFSPVLVVFYLMGIGALIVLNVLWFKLIIAKYHKISAGVKQKLH